MLSNQPAREGLFERTITRWFMRPARVSAVDVLSDHFRLIGFEGESLKDVQWRPGDKVQIKLDGGLATRTYTPIDWDRDRGVTRVLAYAHGDGPGSDWVRAAAVGSERPILGPRRSLDLEGLPAQIVLCGDETSFGLAAALAARRGENGALRCIFEVTSRAESAQVLKLFPFDQLQLIERRAGDAHLPEVIQAVREQIGETAHIVLTGKAASIQQVNRSFKTLGVDRRRVRIKVYWAPGKPGLD